MGPQEELAAWVKPQVEAWAHRVRILGKIARRHPQSAYAGLGMLLQLEWKYLQRTVPGVGTLMGPIEESLREKLPPALFGGKEINSNFRKILVHSANNGSLGIPEPQMSAESAYNTSNASSEELIDSLLGGTSLNYVVHRACVRKASTGVKKDLKHVEMVEPEKRSLQEANKGTASIGQRGMGHGLALYPTTLTAQSCPRRNYGIIFASYTG